VRNRYYYCFGARIVLTGAILASFSLNAAVTNVSTVSPQGATNIVRNIITNNVGNGKLLLVQGTNIVGISTNSFSTSTNLVANRFTTNTYPSGIGAYVTSGTDVLTINDAGTNLFLRTRGDFLYPIFDFIWETDIGFTDITTGNSSTSKHGFAPKLSGSTNQFLNGLGNWATISSVPANGTNNALVIWLTTNTQSFIPNGIGMLTNDGSGNFGYTTNLAQNIIINNLTATNLTVVNALTVSNIITTNISVVNNLYSSNFFVTNVTVQNNLTTSNFYAVNGNHNTLIVTNALSLTSLGTNKLLRIGSNGAVTNIANGSGVLTNDGSGGFSWVTVSGGSSGASVWVPNTALTYSSGTNVTIDGSGGTNFFLNVTNTTFFVTPSNIPASSSSNTSFTVYFKMVTAGSAVTWTNGSFKFPGNSQFQPTTNANAVSWVSFSMSPFTNGIFMSDYGVYDSR